MKKTVEIPVQTRLATIGTADSAARTANLVWTTGAAVKRMDFWTGDVWMEELSCDPSAVRMARMNSGCAPVLNTHNSYDLMAVLGVVERASIDGQQGTAQIRFSKRADVLPIFEDVQDKIIRNVSVGYKVYRYEDVSTPEDQKARMRRMRAMDWEPSEVSLVPVGADPGATMRAEAPKHSCEIEFSERSEETSERHPAGPSAPPAIPSGGEDLQLLCHKLELAFYQYQ